MSKCLIIGDIHLPVVRPGYLDFCKKIRDKYKTDTTIFIGDVIDWHAISFHEKEPMCPNTGDEYEQALAALAPWKKTFPTAIITLGNHDCRPERLAKTVAIPETFLKSYNDLWGTPKWSWVQDITIDDVYYYHGTGRSGIHPAWNVGHQMSMSVVMGHCHSRAGVKWWASPTTRYFAMDVGCGIDIKA
jgi:predicted phosphodiesterase